MTHGKYGKKHILNFVWQWNHKKAKQIDKGISRMVTKIMICYELIGQNNSWAQAIVVDYLVESYGNDKKWLESLERRKEDYQINYE